MAFLLSCRRAASVRQDEQQDSRNGDDAAVDCPFRLPRHEASRQNVDPLKEENAANYNCQSAKDVKDDSHGSIHVEVVSGHYSSAEVRSHLAEQLLLRRAEEQLMIQYQQTRLRARGNVAELRRRSVRLEDVVDPDAWYGVGCGIVIGDRLGPVGPGAAARIDDARARARCQQSDERCAGFRTGGQRLCGAGGCRAGALRGR